MTFMKVYQWFYIDITHTIPIRETEGLFIFHIIFITTAIELFCYTNWYRPCWIPILFCPSLWFFRNKVELRLKFRVKWSPATVAFWWWLQEIIRPVAFTIGARIPFKTSKAFTTEFLWGRPSCLGVEFERWPMELWAWFLQTCMRGMEFYWRIQRPPLSWTSLQSWCTRNWSIQSKIF